MLSRRFRFTVGAIAFAVLAIGPLTTSPARVDAALDAQACIDALRADRDALITLSSDQTTNFNRTTDGSALDRTLDAYIKAVKDRGDALYKAYQYAFQGKKTTANTWVSKANAAVTRANNALKGYNAQIKIINAATDKINATRDTIDSQMGQTDGTCLLFIPN